MGRTLIVIGLVVITFVGVVLDRFPARLGPLHLGSFLFGLVCAISVGFLVFNFRVWDGDLDTCFQTRSSSPKSSPSPFAAVFTGICGLLKGLGVVVAAVFTLLVFYNRWDVILGVLNFLASKGSRLINALLH